MSTPVVATFEDLVRSTIRHGSHESYNVEAEMLSEDLSDLVRSTGERPDPVVCDGWLCEWLTAPNARGYSYLAVTRARPCEVVSAARVLELDA